MFFTEVEELDQNTVDDKNNDQSDTDDHVIRQSLRSSAANPGLTEYCQMD